MIYLCCTELVQANSYSNIHHTPNGIQLFGFFWKCFQTQYFCFGHFARQHRLGTVTITIQHSTLQKKAVSCSATKPKHLLNCHHHNLAFYKAQKFVAYNLKSRASQKQVSTFYILMSICHGVQHFTFTHLCTRPKLQKLKQSILRSHLVLPTTTL